MKLGAIAHSKRPSLIYSWENAASCTGLSVMDVLSKHDGFKSMTRGSIEEIKLEIILHGSWSRRLFLIPLHLREDLPESTRIASSNPV